MDVPIVIVGRRRRKDLKGFPDKAGKIRAKDGIPEPAIGRQCVWCRHGAGSPFLVAGWSEPLPEVSASISVVGRGGLSLEEVCDQRLVFGRKRLAGEFFEGRLAAGAEIEPKFVGKIEQVPSRIAVAARELVDQLFDAGRGLGQNPFFIADGERDFLAERRLQQGFQIRCNRWRPFPRAVGIAAWPGLN